MRVAIDATPLTLSSGGLRRYTHELSVALAENFPQDEFFLVSDQRFGMPHTAPINLRRGGGPRHPAERRWWLWGLDRELQRLEAGLFHGTDFAVPYVPRRPSVLTLHDLSPWMDAAWHSDADRVRQRTPLLIGLGLATMIVTPSEAVRKQAIERFRIHPDRIRAVPHAAAACFRPVAAQPGPPYFLYAGTLEPRKNISGSAGGLARGAPGACRGSGTGRAAPIRFHATFTRAWVADYWGSVRRAAGGTVGGDAGVRLSVVVRGIRAAGARSHAVRGLRHRLAGCGDYGSRRRRRSAGRFAPPNWCKPCWISRHIPSGRSHGGNAGLRRAAEFSWRRTAQLTHEVYEEALRR
jgi:hypothetical protein